jgi:hypothetical protein
MAGFYRIVKEQGKYISLDAAGAGKIQRISVSATPAGQALVSGGRFA